MPRTSRIIIWTLVSFLAVIAAFIIFILVFDWNRARPWINQRISESTGRQFAIQGDLKLAWHKPDTPQSGWSNWVPWPRLSAQDIVLGNPDWLSEPAQMAAIRQVTFTLNPLPLLSHKIVLPVLEIDTPQVFLLRDKDARNNWTFKPSDPSAWDFELQKLILKTGTLQLKDALQKIDIRADIDTLDPDKENCTALAGPSKAHSTTPRSAAAARRARCWRCKMKIRRTRWKPMSASVKPASPPKGH